MRIVDIGAGTGKNEALIRATAIIRNEGYAVDLFSETAENLDSNERISREHLKRQRKLIS